jgi:hypothetical protein
MSVYVDDMRAPFKSGKRTLIMCHMLADTDEELHAMAEALGIVKQHWQRPPKASTSHYDIAQSKRALAVKYGAIEVSMEQMAAMALRRRLAGCMGDPQEAASLYFARKSQDAVQNKKAPMEVTMMARDALHGQMSMNF